MSEQYSGMGLSGKALDTGYPILYDIALFNDNQKGAGMRTRTRLLLTISAMTALATAAYAYAIHGATCAGATHGAAVRRAFGQCISRQLTAVVDYDLTLIQAMETYDFGKMRDDEPVIRLAFPRLGSGRRKLTFVVVDPQSTMPLSLATVLEEIRKRGLRPATAQELLAFSKEFPKQCLNTLFAAGTAVNHENTKLMLSTRFSKYDWDIMSSHQTWKVGVGAEAIKADQTWGPGNRWLAVRDQER